MTGAWLRYYCLCGWLEAAWGFRVALAYAVAYLIAYGPWAVATVGILRLNAVLLQTIGRGGSTLRNLN